jgi:hypothetical protein
MANWSQWPPAAGGPFGQVATGLTIRSRAAHHPGAMADRSDRSGDPILRDLDRARAGLLSALARGDVRAIETLRVTCDALEKRWHRAMEARIERVRRTTHAPASPARLSAGLSPLPPMPKGAGVGVCLSGGGSRAASASMGELRGLRYLGLLEKVSTLSTVSGGTWAGTTFTYLPSDISDDEFLGGVAPDPADLTWTHRSGEDPTRALDVLDAHALGSLATRIGLVEFLAKAAELYMNHGDSPHVLWCRAVGALILEPFGLGAMTARGTPATYFTDAPSWLEPRAAGVPG